MDFLNTTFINSLCWTFLHSLWLALLCVPLAAFVIYFTKNSNPNLRYNLLLSIFGIFMIAVVITFYSSFTSEAISAYNISSNIIPNIYSSNTDLSLVDHENSFQLMQLLIQNIHYVFPIYLLFFLIKVIAFSKEYKKISDLRNKGLSPIENDLLLKFIFLKNQLNITKDVNIFHSIRIDLPIMLGSLKPIILLPLGLVNQLSPEQMEAVILHELAHVKRNDFIVNFIQKIIETIFFFNPALLWLSALIDTEREHCCDEMAMSIHKDKTSFVNAICAINEILFNKPSLVLGFGGQRMPTLQRVKRILLNQNSSLMHLDKSILAVCFLFTSFAGFNLFNVKNKNYYDFKDIADVNQIYAVDSLPGDSLHFAKMHLVKLNNEARKLQQEAMKLDAEQKLLQQEQEKLNHEQNAIDLEAKKMDAEAKKLDIEAMKLDAEARMLDIEATKLDAEAKKLDEESKKQDAIINKMIEEMLNEKIISSKNGLSFSLNKNEFIVNGKKLSKELASKYYKKYGYSNGTTMYNFTIEEK